MFALLATTTLLFAAPHEVAAPTLLSSAPLVLSQEDTDEVTPDKDAIKAALERLKVAFDKDTETPERIEAISSMRDVPCKEVAKALAKGLKDKDLEVVQTTLEVLAKMDVDAALDQLVAFHKRDRRLKDDEALLENTLKAIAWRGDPSTIDLLSDDIFTDASKGVLRARILGLGRIRTTESVKALIGIMKSSSKNKANPYMDELNLSLAVLTGVDKGKSQDRWFSWWNDNKKTLEVSEQPPEIQKQLQRKWDKYWGIKMEKERGEKREDRGRDDG